VLTIKNLTVSVSEKEIIHDLSLKCPKGSISVCMGPNGSGKSSLLHTIMGSPLYTITSGFIEYNGQDITHMPVDKRACLGLFLTLQQPYEIPGVLVSTLLKESFRALHSDTSMDVYIDRLSLSANLLGIDRSMLDRGVHAGFSGGEKKKLEMLQAFIIQPQFLMIDELDSGLDIDARHVVGRALQELKKIVPTMTILMVTHHDTFFTYLPPDYVHVIAQGVIQKSGDMALIAEIEKSGYVQQ
jgi:Fe-S cluster assembly ATP-binding protein